MKLIEIGANVKEFVSDHDTWFLTGLTVAGIGLTAYEAYKLHGTMEKWQEASDKMKAEASPEEQLTPEFKKKFRAEMVRICGPNIVGLGTSMLLAGGSAILNQKVNSGRIEDLSTKVGELTALYNASETGRKIYEEQVEQAVGKDKAGAIKKETIAEEAKRSLRGDIYDTGHGDFLFYLPYTQQWFWSDTDHVKRAFEKLDSSLNPNKYWDNVDIYHRPTICCTKGYFDVNDLCMYLEIPTKVKNIGTELVWAQGMNMECTTDYGGYPGTDDPVTYIRTFDPPIGREAAKKLYGV